MGKDSLNDWVLKEQVRLYAKCKDAWGDLVLYCEQIEAITQLTLNSLNMHLLPEHLSCGSGNYSLRLLHARHDLINDLVKKLKREIDELLRKLGKVLISGVMDWIDFSDNLILYSEHIETIIVPLLDTALETYSISQIKIYHTIIADCSKKLKSKLKNAICRLNQIKEKDIIEYVFDKRLSEKG